MGKRSGTSNPASGVQREQTDSQSLKKSRLMRVREALARRDWAGIGIEMVVVTLGVLLAFRIEQWGQQGARVAEEHEFLERLYRENARSVRELREIYAVHQSTVTQLGTAIRAQDNPTLLRQLAQKEGYGCWGMQMPAATYNTTASEELIASGRLSLISNPALRSQLRELAAAQAEGATQLDHRREVAQLFVPYFHSYHRLSLGSGPAPLCFMDWAGIMRDRNAFNAVVRTYRSHALMEQSRKALLSTAEDTQHALACELHKPACSR